MKLSIALCTYNGERFLAEQLDSILSQTRLPDEVVIGDDRSSDRTVELIQQFADRAAFPVRLEMNESNLGSTRNFERTIQRCSGDIIFLADQDDFWVPEKLRKVEQMFERSSSVGLVFTDADLIDEDGSNLGGRLWEFSFPERRRRRADGRLFYKTLLESNVVTGATAAFRADAVRGCFPTPANIPNMIHDGWIALVLSVSNEVLWSEEPLIKYRQHPGQQLGVNYDEDMAFSRALEILRNQLEAVDAIRASLERYPLLAVGGKIAAEIPNRESEIKAYITHLENRLNLLSKKSGRLRLVFIELLSGRYSRFSKGLLSAAKDIFQASI